MKSLLARIVLAALCLTGFGPVAVAAENNAVYKMARLTLPKADRVVVLKSERKLYLMANNKVMRTYRIALGRYARGQKMREGDARTPEGSYTLEVNVWRMGQDQPQYERLTRTSIVAGTENLMLTMQPKEQ